MFRQTTLWALSCAAVLGTSATITETLIQSGSNNRAIAVCATHRDSFTVAVHSNSQLSVALGMGHNGAIRYGGFSSQLEGMVPGDVSKRLSLAPHNSGHINLMAEANPNTGAAAIVAFQDSHGGISWSGTHPDGPVVALPDSTVGIRLADDSAFIWALFEVRPAIGARRLFVIRKSVALTTQTYPLAAGESILDCVPIPTGGFAVLTGTEAAASVHVINEDLSRSGPFFVGPASQIAYSPAGGGRVLTAGTTGVNAFFTRGPLNAPFTDSRSVLFPFANSGFRFTCAAERVTSAVWWGGQFTNLSSDTDAFICSTADSSALTFRGEIVSISTSNDEKINSIALDPYDRGFWAGTGQVGFFDSTTGSTLKTHPVTPNSDIEYTAAANGSYVGYGIPGTDFAAVGYNASAQQSFFVYVSRRGEPYHAWASAASYVGGATLTVYCRLYAPVTSGSATLPVSSDSPNVIAPPQVVFPTNVATRGVVLSTAPVAASEVVQITFGSTLGETTTASFILMPPTPYFFTPANQTIVGGTTTVCRLSLNGRAPAGGLIVDLTSSGPEVIVGPTVVVPAALYSRSFVIRSQAVGSSVTRTVTATSGGTSRTSNITVTP